MGKIFAVSDIHGNYSLLADRINQLKELYCITNDTSDSMLVFLGDYIDEGPDSLKVLKTIMNLQKCNPTNIIALRGNHDQWFLEFMEGEDSWIDSDINLRTSRSFLSGKQFEKIRKYVLAGEFRKAVLKIRDFIHETHPELMKWMRGMPLYYETETQIFVHAGVDEEAEEWWKAGTSDDFFMNKYPATTGKFYKDIIAGHVGTSLLKGDTDFHDIYFDGESHYYIDGTSNVSRFLPVLVYDTETNVYFSLQMDGTLMEFGKDIHGI